ncbi:carcinine hydrolase/isopenicillin-N N-acyltransferase family protein [Spirillospora albida]|uniref:carcinine hydrolase/isopenicillin-N N-acyltransferase family protein n=1 Tax=Spirillospora albida TaxID=58123 RepID=UPI000690E9B6|nr:carcinine hydrolase/isopenicillin-N N-acyltransferase family protein [Spirillospora albida]
MGRSPWRNKAALAVAAAAMAVAVAVAVAGAVLWWPRGSRAGGGPPGLTADERRSLATLRVIDAGHPLLAMTLYGRYDALRPVTLAPPSERPLACSLFVASRGPRGPLFGRNFDWLRSPAILVTARPPDGPASIALADIGYLGISREEALRAPTDAAVQRRLLRAVVLPFDGVNEHGLAVGLAQVPEARPPREAGRPLVGSARIQRLVLDEARTVDEAIAVFGRYDVEFESDEPPLHYLLADASGRSAAVEYVDGRIRIDRGAGAWHGMVNFVLAETEEAGRRADRRYRAISGRLRGTGGSLGPDDAMSLLQAVAQPHTRWSAVYELRQGTVHLTLNRDYGTRRTFSLKPD